MLITNVRQFDALQLISVERTNAIIYNREKLKSILFSVWTKWIVRKITNQNLFLYDQWVCDEICQH